MPSSCNKSVTSDRLIKPPHLRPGYVDTPVNNGICKYTDYNFKVKKEAKKEVKKDNMASLEESVSKLYIEPTKPNKSYDFGISTYYDRKFKGTLVDYKKQLEVSTTLYVGNLNRLSTEADVRQVFSKAGKIKTIIMGVEKKTGAPGEFCFVEYETRDEAERCINTLQNVFLHRRKLLIDWDAGFAEGRQYRRRFSRHYQRANQMNSHSNKVNHQFNKQQEDPHKNRFSY